MRYALIILCTFFLGILPNASLASETQGTKASVVRDFPRLPGEPKVSGYAQVLIHRHSKSGKSWRGEHRIWFRGWNMYRIQRRDGWKDSDRDFLADMPWFYEVRDRGYVYSGLPGKSSQMEPHWNGYPQGLLPNSLDTYLQWPVKLTSPRYVGFEEMLGHSVSHWHGNVVSVRDGHKLGESDVWVCGERQYPLVLRVEQRTSKGTLSWRVNKLVLNMVPWYMFTAQAHPSDSLQAIRSMVCKPPRLYIAWFVLSLIAYAGLIFMSSWRAEQRLVIFRCLGIVACIGIVLLLGISDNTMYALSLNGALVGLVKLAISVLFCGMVIRIYGLPKDMKIARGTTCASMIFIPVAALLSGAGMYAYQQGLVVGELGIKGWHLPFSGVILIASALMALAAPVVEELVFRGYIFSFLHKHLKSVTAVVLTQALVFGLFHLPTVTYQYGFGMKTVVQIGLMVGLGAVLGLLRQRYRSLLVPWLVHSAWNFGVFYVIGASTLGATQALMKLLAF